MASAGLSCLQLDDSVEPSCPGLSPGLDYPLIRLAHGRSVSSAIDLCSGHRNQPNTHAADVRRNLRGYSDGHIPCDRDIPDRDIDHAVLLLCGSSGHTGQEGCTGEYRGYEDPDTSEYCVLR